MEDLPDHYAALGISPSADQEVIAAAYRALAKKFHPDTGAPRGSASPERFVQVQDAWETLGDPDRRRRYDAMRQRALPPGAPGVTPGPAARKDFRGDTVAPSSRPHALAGERRVTDPAHERGKSPIAPIFAIAACLGLVLLGGLWLMSQWLATPTGQTAGLEEPAVPAAALPASTDPAATASTTKADAPPKPAAPVPRNKPALPAVIEEPPPAASESPQGEILFALSILPQSGGMPLAAEPAQVMFSTRSRCESFGAETLERRRIAALGRNEAAPQERFECVQFSARTP